jgi:hypothetical protein
MSLDLEPLPNANNDIVLNSSLVLKRWENVVFYKHLKSTNYEDFFIHPNY